MIIELYRTCVDCQKELPLTPEYFRPHGGGKKGFRHYCKKCSKTRLADTRTEKCKVNGCDKPVKVKSRQLCSKHNKRFIVYGDVNFVTSESDRRKKCREAALKYKKASPNTYKKLHNRHEHRVVAELKIGRSLKRGEVVHHIDGDKHNNSPENLIIFSSQTEHIQHHKPAKKETCL